MRNPFKPVSTSMDIYPGVVGRTKDGPGKKSPDDCTEKWGRCDIRSDDAWLPVGNTNVPHLCGESGSHSRHICTACNMPKLQAYLA